MGLASQEPGLGWTPVPSSAEHEVIKDPAFSNAQERVAN